MRRYIRFILPLMTLILLGLDVYAQDDLSINISPQESQAKEKKGFFNWVDNILKGKINYDTLYYDNPYGKWSVSLYENLTQHHYYLITNGVSDHIRNRLATSTGVGFSYRGVGLGVSVDFRKLSRKSDDNEFGLRLYGSKIGGDIRIFSVGNFYDTKFKSNVSETNRLKGLNINAYFVFNSKKFSYSAPFSFSKIQKKSAGSAIIVMSYYHDNLTLGYDAKYYNELLKKVYQGDWVEYPVNDTINNIMAGWKTDYISLGAGYAYNWVPAKSWLIHVSLEPSLLIWHKRVMTFNDISYSSSNPNSDFSLTINEDTKTVPYYFFNFGCNGKFSLSYSWTRWYVAGYYVTNTSFFNLKGMDKELYGKSQSFYRYWTARIIVGFRF